MSQCSAALFFIKNLKVSAVHFIAVILVLYLLQVRLNVKLDLT